jgi:hypothetical protein
MSPHSRKKDLQQPYLSRSESAPTLHERRPNLPEKYEETTPRRS